MACELAFFAFSTVTLSHVKLGIAAGLPSCFRFRRCWRQALVFSPYPLLCVLGAGGRGIGWPILCVHILCFCWHCFGLTRKHFFFRVLWRGLWGTAKEHLDESDRKDQRAAGWVWVAATH